MRTTILSVAAAVALLSLCAGCCSTTGQVARGQAPAPLPGDASPISDDGSSIGDNGSPISDEMCYEDGGVPCDGRGRRCNGQGRGDCWVPYHVPDDYVFPTPGPPATVQYPYYTCKGPDCFFHQ